MCDSLPFPVAVLPKSDREEIRVFLDRFKGHSVISLRTFYRPRDGAEMRPTNKGLTVSIRHVPGLAQALAKAEREGRALGLLD